ncbi:MAG TPA: hypothetical protein VIC26_03130, partial [Marinagarivorans sp.]
ALPSLACTLDGKWQSHKTKTLAELYGSKVSNSQKLKLAKVYGKTIIEYANCNTMVVHANGAKTQHTFETIEDSKSAVIIKDTATGEMNMLVKEGNCYKIPVKGMAFYEHFCRL